jgi:uncharacterized protein involved in response to NO
MINKLKQHYFFSQPHQAFFLLAFINALVSMALFTLTFEGTIATSISAKVYHTYSIIFLLFSPAFFAFLFTTFPRFSATESIEQKKYLKVFILYLIASILSYLSHFSPYILAISIFVSFLAHLGATSILLFVYQSSEQEEKFDQFWILIAIAFGLLSQFLLLLSLLFPSLYHLSTQIGIYLYLFLVFFTVAQRMVPFFSHSPIEKHIERFKVIVGLLALHILLEVIERHSSFLVDFVIAYLISRELYRWKLPFPNPNALIWILHIALFWVPIAFLLSSITNFFALMNQASYLYMGIHALTLGFFLTMMIGFGTRVTIGHSGNVMQADSYTKFLFYGTQLVVITRILTSFAIIGDLDILFFFHLSVTLWLVLFILWGYRFFPVLIFRKKIQ